jgi:hypothetical protein
VDGMIVRAGLLAGTVVKSGHEVQPLRLKAAPRFAWAHD